MKINHLFVFVLSSLIFMMSCGKPNDPEVIVPPDVSGGYEIVSVYPTFGYAQDVVVKENLLYIAQGEGGLMIADVTDHANPETISITTENARGYSAGVVLKDTIVYLAAGSFGATAIDATDVLMPFVTDYNTPMKPAKALYIMGDFLISASSEQGVKFADISYPTQLDVRGFISTEGYAQDITVTQDSILFVASGELGLSLYNIRDFQNGYGDYPLIGHCQLPGYSNAIKIIEDETIAFLACGTYGLQVVNYADTANIHVVGQLDAGGYAKDLFYDDQKIFMTTELSGLQIIDVSDFQNPTLIGLVDTEFALRLDVDDDYIYVADEDQGLIIISRPN